MLVWVLYERIPIKPKKESIASSFSLPFCLFCKSIFAWQDSASTLAATLECLSVAPFFAALLAHYFLPDDRLSIPKIAGMLCSFAGIVMIFASRLPHFGYRLSAGRCDRSGRRLSAWGSRIYTKQLTQTMHPARLLFWQAAASIPYSFSLAPYSKAQQGFLRRSRWL